MIFSVPILEVDYYRYLWDGAVTANRINPYEYSPKEIIKGVSINKNDESIQGISNDKIEILANINHPQLKSSYPPVTQAVFAISYLIKPFSLTAWRFVLLVLDIFTFAMIYVVLKKLNIPESNIAIYWLNPLLVKEIFNSAHMDILVFPFILLSLLLVLSNRYSMSFLSLSAGVGIKLWPVLLFPIFIRNVIAGFKSRLKYSFIFLMATFVLLFPLIYSFFERGSGIEAYARSWQNNESVFRIILAFSATLLPLLGYHPGHGQFVSRLIVIILSIMAIFIVNRSKALNDRDIFKKSLILVSFIFIISPVQFPWYYLWLLPFLAIFPYKPLLFYTVLMPLYYLRHYFEPNGGYDFYYNYIVLLEHLPVIGWVSYDFFINKRICYLRGNNSNM